MINKSKLLNTLLQKKTRDYSYTVLFFLLFSFFIFFAIKPSLNTAFSLKKKLADLQRIDKAYEAEIIKVVDLQKKLEAVRDDLYLLEDAVPKKSTVNIIIDDIKQLGEKDKVTINQIDISEVNIKGEPTEGKPVAITISMDLDAKYEDFSNFINDIHNQRRIKLIQNFDISSSQNEAASGSANLKLSMQVDSYYL